MSSVLGSTAEWLRRATARSTTRERPSRRDLFTTAFWLGCVGFGGGISVLSQIDGEVVKKRGWLTAREFSNAVTVSQMLPGGAAVGVLSWVYARFGTVPSADKILAGFNAAVVGIICAITLKMVRTGVNQLWQMGVAAGALLLSAVGSASPAEVVLLAICSGLAVDLGARRALARARGLVGKRSPVALPDDGTPLDPPKREERPPEPEESSDEPPRTGSGTTLHLPLLVGTLGVLAAVVHATGLDAKLIEM